MMAKDRTWPYPGSRVSNTIKVQGDGLFFSLSLCRTAPYVFCRHIVIQNRYVEGDNFNFNKIEEPSVRRCPEELFKRQDGWNPIEL